MFDLQVIHWVVFECVCVRARVRVYAVMMMVLRVLIKYGRSLSRFGYLTCPSLMVKLYNNNKQLKN